MDGFLDTGSVYMGIFHDTQYKFKIEKLFALYTNTVDLKSVRLTALY